MPIPKPNKGEKRKDFFQRCMGNKNMTKEFPDSKQRGGVCGTAWNDKNINNGIFTGKEFANIMKEVDVDNSRKNNLNSVSNLITNFSMRTEVKDGKVYLVVPIVALKEGVHCGSGGCQFYSSTEIDRTAPNWNGVPLTVPHPRKNGKLVSIKEVPGQFEIGFFENARSENGKLKGEGWVDIEKAESISPESLQMIRAGLKMEVSTGLLSKMDGEKGVWNGEPFEQSIYDIVPDHLALLPDEEGACSIRDGCGVRMNSKEECKSCKLNIKGGEKNVGLKFNEKDLTPTGVDSEVEIEVGRIAEVLEGNGYSIKKEIDITNVETKKTKDIIFIEANKEGSKMINDAEKIESLIANEKLSFTKEDSEWLGKMDEKHFSKLYALNDCDCKDEGKLETLTKENALLVEGIESLETKLKANEATEKEAGEQKPPTFDEVIANASPEIKEQFDRGISKYKEEKTGLIKSLLANSRNPFTEGQLNVKKVDELEMLVSLGAVPIDYSAKGLGGTPEIKANERQADGGGVPKVVDPTVVLQENYNKKNR